MKILSRLLVVVLIVHLQCSASCLMSAISARQAEPPCHHHTGPVQPQHGANNACASRPLIPSKVLLQWAATLPPVKVVVSVIGPVLFAASDFSLPAPLSSPHLTPILRI
jgi:hypothetical protein